MHNNTTGITGNLIMNFFRTFFNFFKINFIGRRLFYQRVKISDQLQYKPTLL